MISQAPTALSETGVALCLILIFLVPLAGAGLALINTGLGRSRSAAHSLLASLCVMATAALVYFVVGFSWQGFPGLPAHALTIGGKSWNWLANQPFFLRGIALDGSPTSLRAGAYAAGLARRQGARLVVAYVGPVASMAAELATGHGRALTLYLFPAPGGVSPGGGRGISVR